MFQCMRRAFQSHRATSHASHHLMRPTAYPYPSPIEPPAPPPPPYGVRTIRPPTSPPGSQTQYAGQSTLSRPSIPLPPSFANTRDPPAPPPSRPESSMSISSMLGSDTGPPTRESVTTQRNEARFGNNAAASSPIHTAPVMTSPTRQVIGQSPFRRRSPSPTDHKRVLGAQNRPFRAFSSGSQHHAPPTSSPRSPNVPSATGSLSNIITHTSPNAEHGSGQQWRFSHHRNSSSGKIGRRPNSQPSGHGTPPQNVDLVQQPRSAVSTSERFRDLQVAQKYNKLAQEATNKFRYGPAERKSKEFLNEQIRRAREETTAMVAASRKSPENNRQAQPVPRPTVVTNAANQRFQTDIENVDKVYNHDPRDVPNVTHSPFSPDSLRRSREERFAISGPQPPSLKHSESTQSRYPDRSEEQHRPHCPPAPRPPVADMHRSTSTNGVEINQKAGDDSHTPHARHSLSLLLESGKRGRASPLPQAVQGAQGRSSGPASDPGIKNEFGRMFSGIGGGVGGSGPFGSGTSTPFPASPKVNNEPERRTPFAARGELLDLTRSRERSTGRRPLMTEYEPRVESENGNTSGAVGTPSARASKRKHLHHHHTHNHR